jgi:predicted TIM-barrel fold metal-dependent hydrolase
MVNKYSNIKPFFSIDPRREYKGGPLTLETIKEKILAPNAKFFGIKLYSPAGFSPTDPILMGTDNQPGMFELCEKHNIPITAHNSNSGFACFSTYLKVKGDINWEGSIEKVDKTIKFKNQFIGLKVDGKKPTVTTGDAIKERASTLNHPKLWKLVLAKYPKLTINFAHFGGSGQIMEYVNYEISAERLKVKDYNKALEKATDIEKQIIQSHYQQKGNFLLLNDEMIFTERAKLWNALFSVGLIDNWSKAIFELVRDPNYPNAYTDLSCFSESSFIHQTQSGGKSYFSIRTKLEEFKYNFFDKLNEYEKYKFMYGSDFFLAQFFGPTMDDYFKDFKEVFGADFKRIASVNSERFLNVNAKK